MPRLRDLGNSYPHLGDSHTGYALVIFSNDTSVGGSFEITAQQAVALRCSGLVVHERRFPDTDWPDMLPVVVFWTETASGWGFVREMGWYDAA